MGFVAQLSKRIENWPFPDGAIAMVQSTMKSILTEMEREIEAEVQNKPAVLATSPVKVRLSSVGAPPLAMPDYVEHSAGATEIGKLSAEAVVREYEAAAKEIEAMGAGLIERIAQCQAMTREAFAVTDELKQIAERYREEAKRVFLQIESCSQITAEVRQTCIDLQEKIAVPATIDRSRSKKK
jgi:hypothetical protein